MTPKTWFGIGLLVALAATPLASAHTWIHADLTEETDCAGANNVASVSLLPPGHLGGVTAGRPGSVCVFVGLDGEEPIPSDVSFDF